MNPITEAVLKAGVISPAMLAEMKRISPAVIDAEAEAGDVLSLEEAAHLVEEAMQSEKYVFIRETDLESIRQYMETARTGVLHLEATEFEVSYGRTTLGDYIVAWRSESIAGLMLEDTTWLRTVEGSRVSFKDVRELFFGEHKAFMVCIPTPESHGRNV